MQSIEFEALNSKWSILVETDHDIEKLTEKITKLASDFEAMYSRYDSSSLVVNLNDIGRLIDPPQELKAMSEYALELFEASEGTFDVSICGVLEKNGLGLPGGADQSEDLSEDMIVGGSAIELRNGIHIGFDGFLKGWLVTKLHQHFKTLNIDQFVVDAGGDIQVGNNKESLVIEDPVKSGLILGRVNLVNAALSTTTNLGSEWKFKGKTHVHIPNAIDDELLVIYVLAGTSVIADGLSTVFMTVDHTARINIAKKYGVEFMEVKQGQQIFRTAGFALSDEYVARTAD